MSGARLDRYVVGLLNRFSRQKSRSTLQIAPLDTQDESLEHQNPNFRGDSRGIHFTEEQGLPIRDGRLVHSDGKVENKSRDRRADPLGLTVVYKPDSAPSVDLIFIHGLGGTSRQTWSKNQDPNLFWPGNWLPYEPGISAARIFSFGYNAHFASKSDKDNKLTISDFAKDLLFSMKFATGEDGHGLNIGGVPIIFVVHSMGGLVAKKAIIYGQNDEHYKDLIRAVSGIVFLSTPHRGADMAQNLNRILSACFLTHSSKEYISELRSNSITIQDINEQFRHVAPNMSIVSFFETHFTTVGPSSIMILNKDSSILGYPGEISKPLDADHHNVCKYSSQEDSNYISVRNILRHLIEISQPEHSSHDEPRAVKELHALKIYLGCTEDPNDDLDFFLDRKSTGSCEWVVEHEGFATFLASNSSGPRILWCTGRPGHGKSVLSSFIIQHLINSKSRIAFYFFRFGDHLKTKVNTLLTSIAYQIAALLPEYRKRLVELFDDGLNVRKCVPRLLWQKLFVSNLFNLSITEPLYLVIDGLDECGDPTLAVKLFASVISSESPIKMLLISRATQSLRAAFDRLSSAPTVDKLSLDGIDVDLKAFVQEEVMAMRGDDNLKKRVEHGILQKAGGNFLWTNLVLQDLVGCHTEEEVQQALGEIPQGLEPLYERIDAALSANPRRADIDIGRSILMWVTCAKRALTISELAGALTPDYGQILDLKSTINMVCGDFVVVDGKDSVAMIHATAREYLLRTPALTFHIPFAISHRQIFAKCLSTLISSSPKAQTGVSNSEPFLLYATTSWAFHLGLAADDSDRSCLLLLTRFFGGSSVLSWIYLISVADQLPLLIEASKTITTFLKSIETMDSNRTLSAHGMKEKESLSLWAIDLLRIVGKFGTHLIKHPRLIFKMIAPFCPRRSNLYRQFSSEKGPSTLTVSGLSSSSWDDFLAKFTIPGSYTPQEIKCFPRNFAIRMSNEKVMLYSSGTYEMEKTFIHSGSILTWCFNQSGHRLATYGLGKTIIWDVVTGLQLHSFANPPGAKALSLTFAKNEELLISCSGDSIIRFVSTESPGKWQVLGDASTGAQSNGELHGSPYRVSFSPEGSQIAVSYRTTPVYVWLLEVGQMFLLGRCQRAELEGNPSEVREICWNPTTGHILGCNGYHVFKWHPLEGKYEELSTLEYGGHLKCSPDGNFFITGGMSNTLRIWDFHNFTLIYQLHCSVFVRDIAIDAENARIYDIRENFCSVWELNALLRSEGADIGNNDSQISRESSIEESLTSGVSFEGLPQVLALAVNPENLAYAVGDDEGLVTYFGREGDNLGGSSEDFMTVKHICWSDDGTHVAYSDLGRTVRVKSVGHTRPSESDAVFSVREDWSIEQLLLSPGGEFLLVGTQKDTKIWSVRAQRVISSLKENLCTHWISSPSDSSQILGFGFASICACNWENMNESKIVEVKGRGINDGLGTHSFGLHEIGLVVDKVLLTSDGTMGLVETSEGKYRGRHQGRREKEFMLLPVPNMQGTEAKIIPAKPLPTDLRPRIGFSLGFLATDFATAKRRRPSDQSSRPAPASFGDHLFAFVDKEYWVCTCMLGESRVGRIRRHYLLPFEWWNADSLELAIMRSDGTLLCPKNGEVAILANGLKEEWIE